MEEPTFRDNDLPLMDEYEDTSRRPRLIPEEALLLANNSCIMSNNTAARFWSVVGMKVAMQCNMKTIASSKFIVF